MKMGQIKVVSLKLCILCTLFAFGTAAIEQQNEEINIDLSLDELSAHLSELENQDFCTSKDIVLMIGNVQTSKATLLAHLTDATLLDGNSSVHVDMRSSLPDDSETNSSNEINDPPSGCNDTDAIIPRLVSDQLNGIDYYNCPSVGAQPTFEHDILALQSVKKLLDCSKRRMKLVFTINLPPNRMFELARVDFLSLAEQATTLIKNIAEFRNSTMLVVTEFQDVYINSDGQYQFVDDPNMIVRVATFLYRVKHSLESTNHYYAERMKADIIEFIDILLEKQENEYVKIGVSRLQLHSSAAKNVELLSEEKQRIISILNYRLEYVDVAPMDFDTAISSEMENTIRRRIVNVQNSLSHDINAIDLAVKEFYASKQANMPDVYAFDNEIAVASLKLSTRIRPDQSKPFKEQIIGIINELNISISDHYVEQFSKRIDYVNLLKNVTAVESKQRFSIPVTPLKFTIKYLNDIKKWYSFVIKLSTAMDRYEAQQQINVYDVADLLGNCSIFGDNIADTVINVNKIGLAEFATKMGSSNIYQMVANMTVNGHMLNALKIAVAWAFKPNAVECAGRKFTVNGYNVKISDLISNGCMASASIVEVFAWNKLFVDADIKKIGQRAQVAFIAPKWEVIGDHQIILSGENAQARTGMASQNDVGDGEPGLPGGSSGHFLAIGNTFVNDQQLEIVAVGGKGGDGENGGNNDHKNLTIAEQHRKIVDDLKEISDWFESESRVKTTPDKFSHGICTGYRHYSTDNMVSLQVICENEMRSKNFSGLGGSGGLGGNFGEIVLIGFEQQPKICIIQNAGENGESGKAASDDINGYNSVGLEVPEIVSFQPLQFVDDFTEDMTMRSQHLFRKSYFQGFLTQLGGSETIQLLIDKTQDIVDTRSDDDHFVIN